MTQDFSRSLALSDSGRDGCVDLHPFIEVSGECARIRFSHLALRQRDFAKRDLL